jgi:hypothetical protein
VIGLQALQRSEFKQKTPKVHVKYGLIAIFSIATWAQQ